MKALVGAFNQEIRDCTTSPMDRFTALVTAVSRLAAEAAKVERVCGARAEAASRRVLGGAEAEAWARVGIA